MASARASRTMDEPHEAKGPIRFGVFEVDLLSHTLRKRGVRIRLQELPFRLLAALLERPGEAVTRDELQQQLWSGDQFGEFDVGLNTAITKLRHALNDSASTPRYIETIPKVGYRFIAPLEADLPPTDSDPPASADRVWYRSAWLWPAAAACLLALLAAGWIAPSRPSASSPIFQFTIEPPEGGIIRSFELSPDGLHLAYVVQDAGDVRLWLRTFSEISSRPIEGADRLDPLGTPFWSPDSRYIAYFSDNQLMRVGIAGEPPIPLAPASRGRSGSWNEQDGILFTPNSQDPLYVVPATGGEVQRVSADRDGSHRSPFFLPDGRRYLFTRRVGGVPQLRLGELRRAEAKVLAERTSHAVYVSASGGSGGFLLTVQDGALTAQRFDVETGSFVGAPFPTTIPRVGSDRLMERGLFSVSRTGTLAYLAEDPPPWKSALMWVDRSGELIRRYDVNANPWDVRLSPDGEYVGVYSSVTASPPYFIETVDLRDSRSLRLAGDARPGFAWFPDSSALAFRDQRGYSKVAANGSSEPTPLDLDGPGQLLDVSPNGRWVLFGTLEGRGADADLDLLVGNLSTGKVEPFLASERAHERMGRFSPNGRWVAYSSNETGEHQIYVVRFPDGGGKRRITSGGGVTPVWRPDGRELYFRSPDGMLMAISMDVEGDQAIAGSPQQLFPLQINPLQARDDRERYPEFAWLSFDASADGQRFLLWRDETPFISSPLHVFVNWRQQLEQQAQQQQDAR